LTKTNKYSIFNSGDFIPKRRKYECTNGAQTLVVWAFSNFVENLRTTISKRISIMVKNKVVIKERDAWSDLANFIGEMVAKYADAMGLDQLPNPDCYLRMKRIKQLYKELYKTENIEKFRRIIIPIERNAAA
jgi:hypothetical protein